jgi:hypothetical protein
MNTEIVKFEFNGQAVDFEPSKTNVMVNATQMANIFGKRLDVFLKTEHVKEFISVLEFTPFGGNSELFSKDDIIQTRGKSGTWMHRILALKFAAWLDPKFEVWVYSTIEQLLFGEAAERGKKLTRKAEIKAERKRLQEKLGQNEDFQRLQEINAEEMRLGKEMAGQEKEIVNRQFTLIFEEKQLI